MVSPVLFWPTVCAVRIAPVCGIIAFVLVSYIMTIVTGIVINVVLRTVVAAPCRCGKCYKAAKCYKQCGDDRFHGNRFLLLPLFKNLAVVVNGVANKMLGYFTSIYNFTEN